jgi:hypothetical protein
MPASFVPPRERSTRWPECKPTGPRRLRSPGRRRRRTSTSAELVLLDLADRDCPLVHGQRVAEKEQAVEEVFGHVVVVDGMADVREAAQRDVEARIDRVQMLDLHRQLDANELALAAQLRGQTGLGSHPRPFFDLGPALRRARVRIGDQIVSDRAADLVPERVQGRAGGAAVTGR